MSSAETEHLPSTREAIRTIWKQNRGWKTAAQEPVEQAQQRQVQAPEERAAKGKTVRAVRMEMAVRKKKTAAVPGNRIARSS